MENNFWVVVNGKSGTKIYGDSEAAMADMSGMKDADCQGFKKYNEAKMYFESVYNTENSDDKSPMFYVVMNGLSGNRVYDNEKDAKDDAVAPSSVITKFKTHEEAKEFIFKMAMHEIIDYTESGQQFNIGSPGSSIQTPYSTDFKKDSGVKTPGETVKKEETESKAKKEPPKAKVIDRTKKKQGKTKGPKKITIKGEDTAPLLGTCYAVVNGKEGPCIYTSWNEAQQNTSGVSGIVFKKFKTRDEAREFIIERLPDSYFEEMEEDDEELILSINESDSEERDTIESPVKRNLTAYVDGSYRNGVHCYGYGVVILEHGNIISRMSGADCVKEYLDMRNVAGEITAAITAIEWAERNHATSLVIYHDYTGIQYWADGSWGRKQDLTKYYRNVVLNATRKMKITFKKVKAHSGDKYNNMADNLASEAVDLFAVH